MVHNDDNFYVTVARCKGLERPAAVLAFDGFSDPEVACDVLLAGVLRAREQRALVGDLDPIGEVGGRELRPRLANAMGDGARDAAE